MMHELLASSPILGTRHHNASTPDNNVNPTEAKEEPTTNTTTTTTELTLKCEPNAVVDFRHHQTPQYYDAPPSTAYYHHNHHHHHHDFNNYYYQNQMALMQQLHNNYVAFDGIHPTTSTETNNSIVLPHWRASPPSSISSGSSSKHASPVATNTTNVAVAATQPTNESTSSDYYSMGSNGSTSSAYSDVVPTSSAVAKSIFASVAAAAAGPTHTSLFSTVNSTSSTLYPYDGVYGGYVAPSAVAATSTSTYVAYDGHQSGKKSPLQVVNGGCGSSSSSSQSSFSSSPTSWAGSVLSQHQLVKVSPKVEAVVEQVPGGSHSNNNNSSSSSGHSSGKTDSFEWMKPAKSQSNGKTRTKDKYRVVYTEPQRVELEKEFLFSNYISIKRKSDLSQTLLLSERQIKIWFQNRRAKDRKSKNKNEKNARHGNGNASAAAATAGTSSSRSSEETKQHDEDTTNDDSDDVSDNDNDENDNDENDNDDDDNTSDSRPRAKRPRTEQHPQHHQHHQHQPGAMSASSPTNTYNSVYMHGVGAVGDDPKTASPALVESSGLQLPTTSTSTTYGQSSAGFTQFGGFQYAHSPYLFDQQSFQYAATTTQPAYSGFYAAGASSTSTSTGYAANGVGQYQGMDYANFINY